MLANDSSGTKIVVVKV
jgi:hypothetical protein